MSSRVPLPSRSSLTSIALFAAGALAVLGYGYITREGMPQAAAAARLPHARPSPVRPVADDKRAAEPVTTPMPEPAAAREEKSTVAVTKETVDTLIAQATGTDAAKRTAAIEALGSAPKADAVPVLERVLETADDTDRAVAMRSLRTLAQREGDADNRIRSVVRKVAFHTDNEAAAQAAQETLEQIERDLSQPRSVR